ncbi:MAG TPA: alpha/beta hydrolase [Acidimicrobiales bacterium]|jgi:non-heme chloroperoxidase|nr:alpha/beta hydrolase [Acidimicrobiales bacterium]
MDSRLVRLQGFEGIHLVADVWGDDDDWPVLLMHGGGQTRHAWGGTAEALAASGWKAVSLDLRGHGDSEWALNGDYSFRSYANDCIAVCDQLGRAPVLVGASLGGITALLAEGGSDRRVATGLVMVDITHRSNPAGIQRIQEFMSSGLHGFASLDEAADAIAAYTPHRPKRVNPAGLMKVLRLRNDGRWYWHWDPKFLASGRREAPSDDFQVLFEAAVDRVRVPTLLVRGLLSDIVTEEGVRDFLAKVPGSKLVDVGGASHMVAGDRNDAFSTAVIDFLEHDIRPALPGQ